MLCVEGIGTENDVLLQVAHCARWDTFGQQSDHIIVLVFLNKIITSTCPS